MHLALEAQKLRRYTGCPPNRDGTVDIQRVYSFLHALVEDLLELLVETLWLGHWSNAQLEPGLLDCFERNVIRPSITQVIDSANELPPGVA